MKLFKLKPLIAVMSVIFLCANAGVSFAFQEPTTNSLTKSEAPPENLQKSDIDRFTNAIAEIKNYYVQPISDKKLLEDAIKGMLSGLDPHSEYLDADSYKALMVATAGSFGGLGVEVTSEFGVLKIISPIDGTPASKAGLKPGDYIVAINNKMVNDMTMNEAIENMRGKKGSEITLTIVRKGEKKPLNFKMTREIIKVTSVKSKLLPNHVGYVRISEFQQPTTELMISAIDALKKEAGGNLKGLILDLRNNPGGLLDTAVQVSDVFLNNTSTQKYRNLIVYTEGRLSNSQYSAKVSHPGDILNGAPMVILMNEGSASASEIVAGALQDYHRAIIVGATSFGKGSVQTVLPLDDKHAIKLTTALYHTPSGRTIQNKGITPDVAVDDLKVQPSKTDTSMLAPIREVELKGTLLTKDNTASKKPINDDNAKTQISALAESDFQLYQAYKVISTMVMIGQNQYQIQPSALPVAQSTTASNKTP